ncbi:DMT family transporter [Polycladidibacter hongkongensis]|uniref:DMT family transporter n=1 Tax=Polycladidibacter hongkongensis TaxID=1647556 RepID=UPI00083493EC|nr:DMT family transporter [Pseudovibrio hongkongensis]
MSVQMAPEHNVKAGILWMLFATLMFVALDTLVKYLSQSYPVLQVAWARSFFTFAIMALILFRRIPSLLRPNNFKMTGLRAGIVFLTSIGSVMALSLIPVANMHALVLLAPMIVTALSVPILGEYVGPRRWAAIAVACIGALFIVKPGADVLELGSLIALASVLVYSAGLIVARIASRYDDPTTILFHTALWGSVAGTCYLPFVWQQPDFIGWLLHIAVGALSGIGLFAVTKAFSKAPAAIVAPFNYASLLWAMVAGFTVFGDFPDQSTLLGAAIIISCGAYLWYREGVVRRKENAAKAVKHAG